jgi:hypothetical protein
MELYSGYEYNFQATMEQFVEPPQSRDHPITVSAARLEKPI